MASLEAGLCLSLPPLILANGVAEHTLQQFWLRAAATQAGLSGSQPGEFNRTLTTFYKGQLVRYLVALSWLTVVAYGVFRWTVDAGLAAAWLGLGNLDVVANVFAAGLVAYWLLGWGLFNCMFSLTLACPHFALRALVPSMGAALAVGLPLSLGLGFGFAALGAIAGSAVYVVASSRTTRRVFRAADYYYAAAF